MTQRMISIVCFTLAACACGDGEGRVVGGGGDAGVDSRDARSDTSRGGADPEPNLDASATGPDGSGPTSDGGLDVSDERDTRPDAQVDAAPTGPYVLYLAPSGNDARDGLTEATAIETLTRAQELLSAASVDRDAEVRVMPGTYYGQKVTWSYTRPDHKVSFVRWPADSEQRPVFDGCTSAGGGCPGGTWFGLRHSGGEETNLVFHYIHVRNYSTAISLNGARDAEATSNGSNRIFGCYFEDIGNVFNSSLNPSTAAVRLVNSDDNEIINNHFVNVVNTRSGALIHAIYVAHMSDRNQILRNRFKGSTGDPVRLRDYSNDNVISDNRFIKVGTSAGYTDWYCDHEVRDDCTKPEPECPSWGNQFRDNLLDGTWACTTLPTFEYFQDATTTGCSAPSASARRLRTSGNVQHTPPCTSE